MRSHAIRLGIVMVMAGAALWIANGTASAGGGCYQAPGSGRGDTVQMQNLCFISTVLYVKTGAEVTWTNRDSVEHVVVGAGDTWGDPSQVLFRGDDVSYRFDEDGVFPYSCLIHPGMVGAIVVGDGVGANPAGVVPGTVEAGGAATVEAASAPAVRDAKGNPPVIWIAGAALVLAGLGGAFAIAARNRRKGAVTGS